MRAVNLMPRDERGARLESGRLPLIAAAGGVVAVTAIAFLLASSASGSASETKTELQAVEAAIALVPRSSGSGAPAANAGMFAQERSDRVAALAVALQGRTAFDRVLREISLVMPRDVWLTQLEAKAPAPAVPLPGAAPTPQTGAAKGVTIQGATYSHDSVASLLARLAVVPSLQDVQLTSTALVEPQAESSSSEPGSPTPRKRGKSFVTFVVAASVRTGGAS
jgi:Tfp pilus assembly protein PilN